MTVEDKLRGLILERYKSLREFTKRIDMPYSTAASILERGVANSSVTHVVRICKELRISADELANGRIVSSLESKVPQADELIEINDMLASCKAILLYTDNVTLNGKPINTETAKAIVRGIEIAVELAKKS